MIDQADQYILGLAVAASPCFGYHDSEHGVCVTCPVASQCEVVRVQRTKAIAAGLLAKAAAKAAAKEAAAKAAATVAPKVPDNNLSLDEILGSMGATPAPAPATPATKMPAIQEEEFDLDDLFHSITDISKEVAPAPQPELPQPPQPELPQPPRVVIMKAVVDSVCFVCGGRIVAGNDSGFIPGKGLRHMTCG